MTSVWLNKLIKSWAVSTDSPEEDVEAEHGEHDGHVAQNPDCITQLVDEQKPLVDHPGNSKRQRQ